MQKSPPSGVGAAWVKGILLVVACAISAGIGGGISRHWGASHYDISYSDFISIMLTAISLLMTVLAIFLAVFGVLGWSSIEKRVHEKTEIYLAKIDTRILEQVNTAVQSQTAQVMPVMLQNVEEAIRAKTAELMYEGVDSFEEESAEAIDAQKIEPGAQ